VTAKLAAFLGVINVAPVSNAWSTDFVIVFQLRNQIKYLIKLSIFTMFNHLNIKGDDIEPI
jgi:hypothetical protein